MHIDRKSKKKPVRKIDHSVSNPVLEREPHPDANVEAAPHHDTQIRAQDFDPNVDSAKGATGETFETDSRPKGT